ncbi:MAG: exodeoxyribonuclease VII large subunit, partial [Clostridia bacterium]
MSEIKYLTVTELNFYLNNVVAREELLRGILIMGEVSGISAKGESLFFTVKDDGAQLSAVCFSYKKTYTPTNGERVLLRGSPDFYQKGGRLNFIVASIQPFGVGQLHLELEKLKEKLQKEGLFDEKHKKPLPLYPKSIAVVTSLSGAVVRDIISTVRRYNTFIDITIIDVRVQGEGAASEIINGIRRADASDADVIILARGGGSFEDLLPFSDERVVRAIFAANTPIISAVGHETDFSIADFVADQRALTPTAGAELVAYDSTALIKNIYRMTAAAGERLGYKLDALHSKGERLAKDIYYICRDKFMFWERNVLALAKTAGALTAEKIFLRERQAELLLAKLSALNPAEVLQKGYFKVIKEGKNIQSVSELHIGDEFL